MKLIIDFYKGLDTLNLIIFWGIIIVIILLLIFSLIMLNKNKKLKKLVASKNETNKEENLPIKNEQEITLEINEKEEDIPVIEESKEIENVPEEKTLPLEVENNFIAEEHIIKYNQEETLAIVEQKNNESKEINRLIDIKSPIEIPNKPYQKNVLREMSLSQTSPIGINRQTNHEDKNITMAKDLEKSLKDDEIEKPIVVEEIKKELKNIEDTYQRKTEIKVEPIKTKSNIEVKEIDNNVEKTKSIYETTKNYEPEKVKEEPKKNEMIEEILRANLKNNQPKLQKNNSKDYLEEVSRKLAEAEIPDEIERTNYELQQEEDAIISYKELMEKKDSIQTIDEEDAVISIEELLERNNQKQEKEEEKAKLYKLSDEEENENFINELKQFRNDL